MDTSTLCVQEDVRTPKYHVIKELGTGFNTKIYLAESASDSKRFALKLFTERDSRQSSEESILSEIQHQSVIQWKESIQVEDLVFFSKEDQETCKQLGLSKGFVMEYAAQGDCIELVKKLKMLPHPVIRSFSQQLISVLEDLHAQKIAHRDLKLDNIFLDENFCIKLGDFGAAKVFRDGALSNETVGTEKYFAPEVLQNEEYDPFAADVFALGVCLFELVCGYSPYAEASMEDGLYRLIVEENWDEFWEVHAEIFPSSPVALNPCLRGYFEAILCPDPARRVSITEVKNLEWSKLPVVDRSQVGSWIMEIAKKQKIESMLSSF